MDSFRQVTFFLTVWRAFVATLSAVVLMVVYSAEPTGACLIGANVALVFAIGLILHARSLSAERLDRIEAWRELSPRERPAGPHGRQWAFRLFEEQQLRFAKGAAAVAIALSAAALTLSQTGDVRQTHAEAKSPPAITVAR